MIPSSLRHATGSLAYQSLEGLIMPTELSLGLMDEVKPLPECRLLDTRWQ